MNAVTNPRVTTEVQTASLLVEQKVALVIPSYQRPYVWPSDDVLKLLDDIVAAHDAKEPHYYIGTVLTSASTHDGSKGVARVYELVDGQQRSTTLMLLALAYSQLVPKSPLARFTTIGGKPRLTFDIRDQVQELLSHWAELKDSPYPGDDAIEQNRYLKHMNRAYRAATERLKAIRDKREACYLEGLGAFIYDRVKWVNNTMPDGTDLNRLFASMNTGGVQLEQTDILKSLLLRRIPAEDKPVYDAIWQACENLNDYFERNLRKLFPEADWQSLEFGDLRVYDKDLFPMSHGSSSLSAEVASEQRGMTIAELVSQQGTITDSSWAKKKKSKTDKVDESSVYCRSIVSFSLLLMHTYRIFRHEKGKEDIHTRLNDGYLIECFSRFTRNASPSNIKRFIRYLWRVRFQFDRWVVKWVELPDDDREYLRLSYVSRSESGDNYYLNRTVRETSNCSQLQSVRYFTGEFSAQNWLTPFLGLLIKTKLTDIKDVVALLEKIDNRMSLAEDTQKEASFALLESMDIKTSSIDSVCAELREAHGTAFEHYWFQKLEYILWRNRNRLDCFDFKRKDIGNYRIVSRNSVEHVHPQNEEFDNKLDNAYLHCFGNLALLSPGENSAYSNQSVSKKRADFIDKPGYDSLKLAHIFHSIKASDDWNKDAIEEHQNQMLDLIQAHYREQR